MSLHCSLSNEVPEEPVVSPVSGHVFEKRLLVKYLETHGPKDPMNGEPLTVDQVVVMKSTPLVKPKAPQATSIPALLKALQDEWDAEMLHTFTVKQQLQTARQELSHALYQHDAACRVIARLSRELAAAREALATLKPLPEAEETTPLDEAKGLGDEEIRCIEAKASELTAERKKRGKVAPEGLAGFEEVAATKEVASHVGLHSTSAPGILSLDLWQGRVVTGGNDRNAVVFDLEAERTVSILRGHTKKVNCALFLRDETFGVVTGSSDGTVRIWSGSETVHTFRQHSSSVTGVALHPTRAFLLSVGADGYFALSDILKGHVLLRTAAEGSSGSLTCTQFHPDGLLCGLGTSSGAVQILDVKGGKSMASFQHGAPGESLTCLSFSENGYYLASGGPDGTAKLWDLRKVRAFKSLTVGAGIGALNFDDSGSFLAVGASDVRVYLCKQWDLATTLSSHSAPVTGVAFGPQARSIVSASLDRCVKVYEAPETTKSTQE